MSISAAGTISPSQLTSHPTVSTLNADPAIQVDLRAARRKIVTDEACVSRVMTDATLLLTAVEKGDAKAAEELLNLLYGELRRLAASKMAHEAPGQTLQPTALVHEAWLKLVDSKNPKFENRAHFFSAAAEAMRRILIDRARRKLTQRHGASLERVDLDGLELVSPGPDERLLGVQEVLDDLAKIYPIQAEVVKLRYFVGMTYEETAEALGISVATVCNYWTFARTWIFNEIKNS